MHAMSRVYDYSPCGVSPHSFLFHRMFNFDLLASSGSEFSRQLDLKYYSSNFVQDPFLVAQKFNIMTAPENISYLIVGGGVFGASTACHLSKAHPESTIVLIDRSATYPCSLAASYDFNKIIRADYGNPFYCKLALEAREAWKSEALYQPFYHESGMVNMDDTGLGRRILKNYETLGVDPGASMLTPDEMKVRYDGLFADTDYQGVEEIYLNPSSGWGEATLALKAVIRASIANGVEYRPGDVMSLSFDESGGSCNGVTFQDGSLLQAENVILCTGAGTAKLLAKSAPDRENLQAGNRITAAAVVTGIVKLSLEQGKRFLKCPVFVHAIDGVLGTVSTITFISR